MKKQKVAEKRAKKKRGMLEIFAESFKKLFEQPVIIVPFLFTMLAAALGAAIFFVIFFLAILAAEKTAASLVIAIGIIVGVIVAGALVFVSAFFYAGAFGMAKEILNKKKVSLKTMINYGKKFWLRLVGVYVLVSVIFLVLFALLFGVFIAGTMANASDMTDPASLFQKSSLLMFFLFFICMLLAALFMLLFLLSPFYLVLENLPVIKAIKRGFSVSLHNYLGLFGISVMFFLLNFVIGFVPFVGGLISMFIISPAATLAWMLFAIDRR